MVRQTTRFPERGHGRAWRSPPTVRCASRLRVRHPVWATSGFALDGQRRVAADRLDAGLVPLDRPRVGDGRHRRRATCPCRCATKRCRATPTRSRFSTGRFCWPANSGARGSTRREALRAQRAAALESAPRWRCPRWSRPSRRAAGGRRAGPQTAPDVSHRRASASPRDVTLVPFYQANQTRYSVYWKMSLAGGLGRRGRRREAARRRPRRAWSTASISTRRQASRRTASVARRRPSRNSRDESAARPGSGWFSYELEVPPDRPVAWWRMLPRRRGPATRVRRARGWRDHRTRDTALPPHRVARKDLRGARER